MRARAYLRMLGAGITLQAITSVSSLAVGLFLIRRASNDEYGFYVLLSTAVQFSIVVQGSFIQPPMILRLTREDRLGRANLIGGLHRDQRRLIPLVMIPAAALILVLGIAGRLHYEQAALLIVGCAAVMASLQREFFRMVLFGYRLAHDVLKADCIYCLLMVGGTAMATLTAYAAVLAAVVMTCSAFIARHLLASALWRHEPWNRSAPAGTFAQIFSQGSWSALGGGLRFACSQGYTYLVAGTLGVPAVATLAATRLPVSPAALLSNGVATFMSPTIASWTRDFEARAALRLVTYSALALTGAICSFLLVMWLTRDWIFAHALKKNIDSRDSLLLLWSAITVVVALRDQLMYFLTARGRFRATSAITIMSTILSLGSSFAAMFYLGIIGAPMGILIGELLNFSCMIGLSLREAR